MKLGTLRRDGGTIAVRVDAEAAVRIGGVPDVGALLTDPDWRAVAAAAAGPAHSLDAISLDSWAPVVPRPGKIVCVGLNYREHILETGREIPTAPTLFTKYPEALVGAGDPIVVPPWASEQVDWEGELAVVVGRRAHRVAVEDAGAHIAGYALFDDVSMRDWQYRTLQWLAGKSFERSTPFGPWLVTPDEFSPGPEIVVTVDGQQMQRGATGDLAFGPEALIADITRIFPLEPGDVIATGTPGGVGHARDPKVFLRDGSVVTVVIAGLGEQRNTVVVE